MMWARGRRCRRRAADGRRPRAGQRLSAAAVVPAVLPRHDVSRGQAVVHQHGAAVRAARPARRRAGPSRRRSFVTHRPHVSFEGSASATDARREILHGVDFEIRPGVRSPCRALRLGQVDSGATDVPLLRCRRRPHPGRTAARPARRHGRKTLRAAIGIVPQDTVLFQRHDPLQHPLRPSEAGRERSEAPRAPPTSDFIVTLPDGYETQVGERGLKLRGGEAAGRDRHGPF